MAALGGTVVPAENRRSAVSLEDSKGRSGLRDLCPVGFLDCKKPTDECFDLGPPWPPAPLPARRAYRPEGGSYASESATASIY